MPLCQNLKVIKRKVNMNILITSAGQRVSLVRAFQKEIKQYYENAKVFTTDLNPILAPACHISDGYFTVPRVTDVTYMDTLLEICLENDVKLVVPTIDTELLVLSKYKEKFKEKDIQLVVCDTLLVEQCRDKRLTNKLFEEKGILVPEQYDKQHLKYPVFVKPYDGSLSKGIFIAYSSSDIKIEHLENEKLMFMQFISPDEYDEFTVDCYFDRNSRLKCAVPRQRIFVRAGEINKGVTQKNSITSEFKKHLSHIHGAIGCLTIQVFYNKINQAILGIEINPRFGGGYPLSYLAGANYPKWLIQEYLLGEDILEYNDWEDKLLMLRYDAEVLVKHYEN